MPNVPAVCETCGAFFPSGIVVDNSTNITFASVSVGPCPRCGGRGHIPDGVYNFLGNTIELLRGPERTVGELQALASILRDAKQRRADPDDTRAAVARAAPGLTPLFNFAPQNRAEWYDFIAMLAAIVSVILAYKAMTMAPPSSQPIATQEVNVNIGQIHVGQLTTDQIIGAAMEQLATPAATGMDGGDQRATPRELGRNERCWCGSGKKYKRCHLNSGEIGTSSRP